MNSTTLIQKISHDVGISEEQAEMAIDRLLFYVEREFPNLMGDLLSIDVEDAHEDPHYQQEELPIF